MPKINRLTKEIAQKIAAGEVVERPASVVKELLENAIDAGATELTVEIQHGGVRYIRLTDNGCGIAREDVPTAFLSHATSKICKASDLDSIMTLGFRGEALPSIAAVSHMEMLTKQKADFAGTRIVLEGGTVLSVEDAGCPNGTTILVRDLFFNTPARMKFLKSDRAEGMAVSALVDHLALSHPEIAFRFIKDGRVQTSTPGNGDLHACIYALYGKAFADFLLPASFAQEGICVHGFVSSPHAARGSNAMQHFFVNNRYFKTRTGAAALSEAYKNSLMVGRFPAAVLFIEVDPSRIDVNVHPAKTEVRFSNERALFNCIYVAAKQALETDRTKREAVLPPQKGEHTGLFQKKLPTGEQMTMPPACIQTPSVHPAAEPRISPAKPQTQNTAYAEKPVFKPTPDAIFAYTKELQTAVCDAGTVYEHGNASDLPDLSVPTASAQPISSVQEQLTEAGTEKPLLCAENEKLSAAAASVSAPVQPAETQNIHVLGEVFQTYLLVQVNEELLIIDKHAAHERMLFNRLKKDNGANGAQMLLVPVTVTLSKDEYAVLTEHMDLLTQAGFAAEDFGEGTILLRGCPLNLEGEDFTALLTEIAGYLLKNHRDTTVKQLDWVYHSIACRAAIKAGNDLKPYEIEHFVRELLAHDEIRFCPHGRPVLVALTRQELDKQFGRLG